MKHGFHIASALVALTVTGASLAATQAKPMKGMAGMQDVQGMQHAQEAHGVGIVRAIDTANGTITLQHQAIASIGWPAMTMAFHTTPEVLKQAKVGEKVQFTLHPDGMRSVVTAIHRA